MTHRPAAAAVRTSVRLPVDLADGRRTTASAFTFDGLADGQPHLALAFGNPDAWPRPTVRRERPVPVRVHSECLTGDVFGSGRCDCGPQLAEALGRLDETGGLLLYLRQEGRGIGLYAKLDAYALQDTGLDTFEANVALGFEEDARDYTAAAQMLRALGVERVMLLTNNPDKASQLADLGVDVAEVVPTGLHLTADNVRYLRAKADRDHTLDVPVEQVRRRG